jgi:hypothetical protein
VTVSLLVCEDVRVAFSFEASMLSVGWDVLWNVTDKRLEDRVLKRAEKDSSLPGKSA